jgi:uncharacterized membrane protein
MSTSPPRRARWSLTALAVALAGGAMIGWHIRHIPVLAVATGIAASFTIIACTEIVRRRINRDASIETEWKRIADAWRRRYL